MDAKTVIIVIGLIVVLYLQGYFPTAAASSQQQTSAPAMAPSDCYAQVNAAVRDDWPLMTVTERAVVAMRATQICEGGQP
jgi:hypothetical protein